MKKISNRGKKGERPTISDNPPTNKYQRQHDVKYPNGPELVRTAPRYDAPIRPKAPAVLVVCVGVVRPIEGLFFEDLFICEGCVFDYDMVQDGAEDVCF